MARRYLSIAVYVVAMLLVAYQIFDKDGLDDIAIAVIFIIYAAIWLGVMLVRHRRKQD